ncbi:hypothetical protein [Alistipes senegalensis]|uniref:hypothetical protein n=1 Tax=Alistipes senegalensis TaxID=1288121 RepID=UPI00242E4C23|nr:hypothetical protein [Alistipes senegalensis]
MTKYYSLFGGMTTDTEIQVAQENQIVIDEGPGALTVRYVIYKVEHDADGYIYHMIDPDTKEIRRTDILQPYSQKFGIGMYYTDTPAEFMDASEVAILVGEAEQKAKEKSEAQARSQAEHDRIAAIGAERLERLMPADVKGVILAELNETRYTDPSYECRETRSVRTVILGFSTTTRNGLGELRRAARNLPETASLAEYNKDYEHRYPCFTLGKSPYSGWSIHKMSHYTREGFIGRLAYIAGNEENIRLESPKQEPTQAQEQTTVQGEFILVNYSDKAIALFGDTKPIKDLLSDLGGRFNSRLTRNRAKCAGWIFQKAKEAQVRELIGMAE